MTKNSTRRTTVFLSALPLTLGIVAFFIVVGPRALNPLNIAWLEAGDPATHYLGWLFFRDSPWTFPIGLNPRYGLELSSAIVYSDSNPLLAFLFKPFSPLLPNPFQYSGFWLLICFCLQSWFGWKLIGLISSSVTIRLLGAGLLVFAPPMICRLQAHLSLVGHFVIVAALYFAFSSKQEMRRLAWGALLATAALVHAYLLALVALIWITDLCGNTIKKIVSARGAAIELALLVAVVGFACWQAGYFSVRSGVDGGGFGDFRMNLLSLFDSNGLSYVLGDIPNAPGEYEGFNYLGLGVIFLAIVSIPVIASGRAEVIRIVGTRLHLLFLLLFFTVYAASNKVGLGQLEYKYALPEFVMQAGSVFRASGRVFWPVFYAIVFAAIFLVVRGYNGRTAALLLGLALVIQVVDTSAGWLGIRKVLMTTPSSNWNTSLTDPFWENAASKYARIRHISVGNKLPNWQVLASYAGVHGLGSDSVYLARVGSLELKRAQQKAASALKSGNLEQDSLYILDDISFREAVMAFDKYTALFARIDGYNVIAPGWKNCADCRHVDNEIKPGDFFPPITLGKQVLFSPSGTGGKYLHKGWWSPEDWGIWSSGTSAVMLLPLPPEGISTIVFEAHVMVSPSHEKQLVTISINGAPVPPLTLTEPVSVFEVKIPEGVKQSAHGYLRLGFNFPDAVRPTEIGVRKDERTLAIGLISMTVH